CHIACRGDVTPAHFCASLFKAHSRRQLLANATIAASRVAAHSARRSLHCGILIPSMSALDHFRQIGAVATLRGCPLRPASGHWELSTLARSSRGPPISHWDGFLASLRLGPHACDCCTLESALGLIECERSVKWL